MRALDFPRAPWKRALDALRGFAENQLNSRLSKCFELILNAIWWPFKMFLIAFPVHKKTCEKNP